jgi:hypothetical protein
MRLQAQPTGPWQVPQRDPMMDGPMARKTTSRSRPTRTTKAKPATFTALLLEGHKGCAVEVPFDPGSRWDLAPGPLWRGRRGHRVAATLNGIPFHDAIVPRSRRFWLLVSESVMADAAVAAGDRVEISVAPLPADGAPRAKRM